MGNYNSLNAEISKKSDNRILIIDNNNLEFCTQNEESFSADVIFKNYDIILIPEWVHAEITHSEKRMQYLASIDIPYFILREEEDYTKFVEFQDYRLMRLFEHASISITKARRYFSELKKYYSKNDDLPENWISDYYDCGFDIKVTKNLIDGEEVELRKNAGETSILVLTYLLLHHYSSEVKQITIFSSDKGSLTIKKNIMEKLSKIELIHNNTSSISFKSTDILIIEAIKEQRVEIEDIPKLRPNSKTVIYTHLLGDHSISRHEHVMSTDEFMKVMTNIEEYHFEF